MKHTSGWQRLAGGTAAVALGVASAVVGVASPAQATSLWFTRYEATSANDTASPKSAVVDCPAGEQVHSTGGRINNGQGGVALTAIIPNSALTSVTAKGEVRPNHAGAWSVTAFAVCFDPDTDTNDTVDTDPVRVSSGAVAGNNATTAACPNGKHLMGVGFDLSSLAFVDKVAPTPDRTQVEVRAYGYGIVGVTVKAYGICGRFGYIESDEASSDFNGISPKIAITPMVEDQYVSLPNKLAVAFSLGGMVDGGLGNVLLDAMFPQNGVRVVRAQATVASPIFPPVGGGPGPLVVARAGADSHAGVDTDDDWSTIVYADYADWY